MALGHEVLIGAIDMPLSDGSSGVVYLFEMCPEVGQSFCEPAVPNSTGFTARLTVSGPSTSIDQALSFSADDLPTGRTSRLLVSDGQGFTVPPGSDGNLCLAGQIGRYAPINSKKDGAITGFVDPTELPVGAGVAAHPGETWHFQVWFRDSNPGETSNFTQGVSITFQ